VPIVDWRRVDRLVASGHLTREGERIATTAKGRLLLDSILGEIAAVESQGFGGVVTAAGVGAGVTGLTEATAGAVAGGVADLAGGAFTSATYL
jgi:hypothetical protein